MRAEAVYRAVERGGRRGGLVVAVAATTTATSSTMVAEVVEVVAAAVAATAAAMVVATWHRASERDDGNRQVDGREKPREKERERQGEGNMPYGGRIGKEKRCIRQTRARRRSCGTEGERRCTIAGGGGGRGRKKRSYLVDASEMTVEFRVEREGRG